MLDYDKLEKLREEACVPEDFQTVFWTTLTPRLDEKCYDGLDMTTEEALENVTDGVRKELAKRDLVGRCDLMPLVQDLHELEAMEAGYRRRGGGSMLERLGVRIQTGFALSPGASWEDAVCDKVDMERDCDKEELTMIFSRADVARKLARLMEIYPEHAVGLTALRRLYMLGARWNKTVRWVEKRVDGKLKDDPEVEIEAGLLIWADEILGLKKRSRRSRMTEIGLAES